MINRCVLVGRLTADPSLKYTSSGLAVATFTLAVNRPFSKDGQKEADFINCVVWRKAAESTANYLKKGSLAGVDGRVQTRNYEGQDGKRVYVTEIVAESVQFLDTKSSSEQRGSQSENNEQKGSPFGSSNRSQSSKNDDPFANPGQPIDISDDELPF